MKNKDKQQFCPFSKTGCYTPTHICMFWRTGNNCELERLIHDLRSIPNLLRHIENELEEGKQI